MTNKFFFFLSCITVQASIAANTWVVSGSPQIKSISHSLLQPLIFSRMHVCLFSVAFYVSLFHSGRGLHELLT